jgi:hypothetical protein
VENWLIVVNDAVMAALEMATKSEDVMAIFKKNKQLFDAIKAADAEFFKDMMASFTERKNQLGAA